MIKHKGPPSRTLHCNLLIPCGDLPNTSEEKNLKQSKADKAKSPVRRATIHKLPDKAPTPRDDSESSDDDVSLVLYRPPAEPSTTESDIALPSVQQPSSPPNDQIETPEGFDSPSSAGGDPPYHSSPIDAVPDTFNSPVFAQSEHTEVTGQLLDSGQPAPDNQATVINESEVLLPSRPQQIGQPPSRLSYYGSGNPLYCTQISTSWPPVPQSMNNNISNYRSGQPTFGHTMGIMPPHPYSKGHMTPTISQYVTFSPIQPYYPGMLGINTDNPHMPPLPLIYEPRPILSY